MKIKKKNNEDLICKNSKDKKLKVLLLYFCFLNFIIYKISLKFGVLLTFLS